MRREPQLTAQTVVVIGGSSGIGFETARRVRDEGAKVIITAREPDRLHHAGLELKASIAAFDATDFDRLGRFFDELPLPIDHVLVTVPGSLLPVEVARNAVGKVRAGGTLLFIGETGGQRPAGALPALTRDLALEVAPIRVNLIAAGRPAAPADVAALAVHVMTNAAVTGATFDTSESARAFDGRDGHSNARPSFQ